MKRGLFLIALLILSVGLFGQNKFKYQIQATGGLSVGVGGDTVKLDSVIYSDARLKFYRGSSELSTIGTGSQIGLIAPLKADTIPLFVFGLGSGVAADTAVFNTNAIAGAFYNAGSDTLMITSIRGVLAEGSGTESVSVQISWHTTFKSGSAVNLNSSALAITSITTGTEDTSFANSTIPPGVWVWCTISGINLGDRPSLLILTMSGYKQNRSY